MEGGVEECGVEVMGGGVGCQGVGEGDLGVEVLAMAPGGRESLEGRAVVETGGGQFRVEAVGRGGLRLPRAATPPRPKRPGGGAVLWQPLSESHWRDMSRRHPRPLPPRSGPRPQPWSRHRHCHRRRRPRRRGGRAAWMDGLGSPPRQAARREAGAVRPPPPAAAAAPGGSVRPPGRCRCARRCGGRGRGVRYPGGVGCRARRDPRARRARQGEATGEEAAAVWEVERPLPAGGASRCRARWRPGRRCRARCGASRAGVGRGRWAGRLCSE